MLLLESLWVGGWVGGWVGVIYVQRAASSWGVWWGRAAMPLLTSEEEEEEEVGRWEES